MVGEIIRVHIGPDGKHVGASALANIATEHGLDGSGRYMADEATRTSRLERAGVLFEEHASRGSKPSLYSPRAVVVDQESSRLEPGLASGLQPDSRYRVAIPTFSCGEKWAHAHQATSASAVGLQIERMVDLIRQQSEACDSIQGFHLYYNVGCAVGSPVASRLAAELGMAFPLCSIASTVMLPPKSAPALSPYNAVLGLSMNILDSSITNLIDLESVLPRFPSRSSCLEALGRLDCHWSAPLRFAPPRGQAVPQTSSLRKIRYSMVPFYRLHFFSLSLLESCCAETLWAPRAASGAASAAGGATPTSSVDDSVWRSLFTNPDLSFSGPLSSPESTFSYSAHVRQLEVADSASSDSGSRRLIRPPPLSEHASTVPWLPGGGQYTTGILLSPWRRSALRNDRPQQAATAAPSPPAEPEPAAAGVLFLNGGGVAQPMERVLEQFSAMYERKAHLHYLSDAGVDLLDFEEARSRVRDQLTFYAYTCGQTAMRTLDCESHNEEDF